MKDRFGRKINYLRISVTDLCNLRCKYCMPEEGIEKVDHDDILTVEDIVGITETFSQLGVDKVRLTGGEPLVKNGILEIVRGIGEIEEIKDFSMTTNGLLLEDYAEELKEYGLNRVNISLDSLDRNKYKDITRGGDITKVFRGIEACREAGLGPIKINTVLMEGFNDDEIEDFIALTKYEDIDVRFIELMPIGEAIDYKDRYLNNDKIIESYPELKAIEKNDRSSPADYYRLEDGKGRVGFINPISCKFCEECNRLRLTSRGTIKTCLHGEEEYDIKEYLDENLLNRLVELIYKKPEKHNLENGKYVDEKMNRIGG